MLWLVWCVLGHFGKAYWPLWSKWFGHFHEPQPFGDLTNTQGNHPFPASKPWPILLENKRLVLDGIALGLHASKRHHCLPDERLSWRLLYIPVVSWTRLHALFLIQLVNGLASVHLMIWLPEHGCVFLAPALLGHSLGEDYMHSWPVYTTTMPHSSLHSCG